MPISKIKISTFRNIIDAYLEFSKHFNVFYGDNGAGKTSLLEAIYYLGFGKSFRASDVTQVIHAQSDKFSLFLEEIGEEGSTGSHKLGLEKNRAGDKTLRIDAEPATLSQAAKILPLRFISTDSHRIFHDGPKERRRAMDWGTFHVKHSFINDWNNFQKALKHRNALLQQERSFSALKTKLSPWDEVILSSSENINEARKEYLKTLVPLFSSVVERLLPKKKDILIEYRAGWPEKKGLKASLEEGLEKDLAAGFTQTGPHRADLLFSYNETTLQDYFSQGQQKLAAYAFQLAQGLLLKECLNKTPIYLIDDLSSELDLPNRKLVLKTLVEMGAQCFIAEISDFNEIKVLLPDATMFHVKHGTVSVG